MTAIGANDRPTYTDAQRQAVLADGHTLLEAGAGSGKTTTLVGRILHAMGAEVVEGARVARPCALGEIAAITFTVAAATDLKAALRRRLHAEAARTGDRRWRRAAYEVDRARIGTIHGFCGGLLREFGLRAGLDPAFRISDAAESAQLRERAARAVVLRALRDGERDAQGLVFAWGPDAAIREVGRAMDAGDAAWRALDRWCDPAGARLDALRARTLELGGAWDDGRDAPSVRHAAAALRLAREARTRVERRLDEDGALDYDGLVDRARRLLRDDATVRAAVRRRLRLLLVDEFQDTDPAQRDLVYAICGVGGADVADAPALCVVGDPKQSIYGFRRADVTLWNAVAADMRRAGATMVPLDVNYRSRAPILGLVNATFGALMPPLDAAVEAPAHAVRYRALAAARALPGDDALVELLRLPADGTAEERRATEAWTIARRVREIVDGREPVVCDADEEPRAVSWGGVALLFRTASNVATYEAALRRLGVPCHARVGGGWHGTREVRDVVLLLRALLDARDDLAWLGLLRSPMVGLSDDALVRLRLEHPGRAFGEALEAELPGDDGPALRAAAAWVAELRALRDRVPNAVLTERALERTGYATYLLTQEGGDAALANVRKLVRVADGRPGESLAALVAHLEAQREAGVREGDAPLHTAGEDVVTLTTVHGAKGLEWPVVFLCDLERDPNAGRSDARLLFDEADGIALKPAADATDDEATADDDGVPGAYETLRRRAAERDLSEELRVWYVAATRARDRLVLCACDPALAKPARGAVPTAASWLLSRASVADDAFTYADAGTSWSGRVVVEVRDDVAETDPPRPPEPATLDDARDEDDDARALRRRIAAAPPVAPLFRRSATELMTLDRDADAHRRAYALGLRAPSSAAGTGAPRTGLDARTTGDVVHAVLEHEAAALAQDLDRILDREVTRRLGEEAAAALDPADRDRLRRLVDGARTHAAVARLTEADAEHELEYTWFARDAEGNVLGVFQGAMDLVARVDGALEALDFKTHRLRPGDEAAAAAHYDLQRDLYALALSDVVDRPAAFSFFFPETGGEVRDALDADALELARAAIVARLAAADGGEA